VFGRRLTYRLEIRVESCFTIASASGSRILVSGGCRVDVETAIPPAKAAFRLGSFKRSLPSLSTVELQRGKGKLGAQVANPRCGNFLNRSWWRSWRLAAGNPWRRLSLAGAGGGPP